MTPAASQTPTSVQAQRAEDQASSGGTCCKFFLPTRRPHEESHDSGDSLDTTILRNMGQGWCGLGAQAFGRCVGKAPGSQWVESSSETLLTAQESVCHYSTGFTGCYLGLHIKVLLIYIFIFFIVPELSRWLFWIKVVPSVVPTNISETFLFQLDFM